MHCHLLILFICRDDVRVLNTATRQLSELLSGLTRQFRKQNGDILIYCLHLFHQISAKPIQINSSMIFRATFVKYIKRLIIRSEQVKV